MSSTGTSNNTINITPQNIYGNCDLKCSYNFKYNPSNSVATNNDISLSLSYEKSNIAPVLYNTNKYYVSKIDIFSPSLHNFNGATTNAELIIEHTPEMGGDSLYVCIPIIESSNSSDSSNMLTQIIESVANNAPSANETTNLNINNFNLNTFVPNKPFFSYTGTEGLVGQVIVFGILFAIPLNKKTLEMLSSVIKPYPITLGGGNLFLNTKGPNSTPAEMDGIYISCQPTGSSVDEVEITYSNKNPVQYNLGSLFSNSNSVTNQVVRILIGCILFILIFFALNFLFNYFISFNNKKTFTAIRSN